MQADVPVFKVVLVGDAKAGKTSLLVRWSRDEFGEHYEPTVSPELTTKDVLVDGRVVRLQVWDNGFGETDVIAQFPQYVGGATGVLLMYDMTDVNAMDGVTHWFEQARSFAGQSCAFVVVGCKSDLRPAAGVSSKALGFAQSARAEHIETSAQRGDGADRAFQSLARALWQQANPTSMVVTPSLGPAQMQAAGMEATIPAISDAPATFVKLVLLGEPSVGKSCIAQKLGVEEGAMFEEEYVPTPGPEILTRAITVNGVNVKLQVWDAAGQDLMHNPKVCAPVLQNADAAILVYDITSRESFESVGRWFHLLEGQVDPEAVAVMLIGNKSDAPNRAVTSERGRSQSEAMRVPFSEFSAKRGTDIVGLLGALLRGNRPPPNWGAADAVSAEQPRASSMASALNSTLDRATPTKAGRVASPQFGALGFAPRSPTAFDSKNPKPTDLSGASELSDTLPAGFPALASLGLGRAPRDNDTLSVTTGAVPRQDPLAATAPVVPVITPATSPQNASSTIGARGELRDFGPRKVSAEKGSADLRPSSQSAPRPMEPRQSEPLPKRQPRPGAAPSGDRRAIRGAESEGSPPAASGFGSVAAEARAPPPGGSVSMPPDPSNFAKSGTRGPSEPVGNPNGAQRATGLSMQAPVSRISGETTHVSGKSPGGVQRPTGNIGNQDAAAFRPAPNSSSRPGEGSKPGQGSRPGEGLARPGAVASTSIGSTTKEVHVSVLYGNTKDPAGATDPSQVGSAGGNQATYDGWNAHSGSCPGSGAVPPRSPSQQLISPQAKAGAANLSGYQQAESSQMPPQRTQPQPWQRPGQPQPQQAQSGPGRDDRRLSDQDPLIKSVRPGQERVGSGTGASGSSQPMAGRLAAAGGGDGASPLAQPWGGTAAPQRNSPTPMQAGRARGPGGVSPSPAQRPGSYAPQGRTAAAGLTPARQQQQQVPQQQQQPAYAQGAARAQSPVAFTYHQGPPQGAPSSYMFR